MPSSLRFSTAIVLAGLIVGASLATESPDPDPRKADLAPRERLEALLEQSRQRQSEIETLEAEFRQWKESSLLVEPAEARGVFSYAAPDRVRWEYEYPDPISLLIADEELTTWYRDIDRVERANVGRRSQRVLEYLGAGSSLDDLLKYFTVAIMVPESREDPYRLELTPRFARVARRLQGMEVWIDSELYLPVALQYVEADGDVTKYEFENYRVNGELPEGRFDLQLPRDLEVKNVEFEGRPALR